MLYTSRLAAQRLLQEGRLPSIRHRAHRSSVPRSDQRQVARSTPRLLRSRKETLRTSRSCPPSQRGSRCSTLRTPGRCCRHLGTRRTWRGSSNQFSTAKRSAERVGRNPNTNLKPAFFDQPGGCLSKSPLGDDVGAFDRIGHRRAQPRRQVVRHLHGTCRSFSSNSAPAISRIVPPLLTKRASPRLTDASEEERK